jgi:threonine synthase
MTTVEDANVHNIAIDGNFDDCQDLVKTLFADTEYRKERHLVAVNSINWARILAQVVYYFYAALHLGAPGKAMSFSVPTGNFGDIFAGYIARRMGLPIDQLIIATNRNDILARCVEKGEYAMEWVEPTISPSMDIQISSNFERLLFDLYDRNSQQIDGLMREFRSSKKIVLDAQPLTALKTQFASAKVDDVTTKQVIKEVYGQTGELLDPHTAVGVKAGRDCWNRQSPLITLATAHPAKFPDAVKAASGVHPALPPHMQDLFEKTERFDTLSNDIDALKAYIGQQA